MCKEKRMQWTVLEGCMCSVSLFKNIPVKLFLRGILQFKECEIQLLEFVEIFCMCFFPNDYLSIKNNYAIPRNIPHVHYTFQ